MVFKHVGKTLKVNSLKTIHIDKELVKEFVLNLNGTFEDMRGWERRITFISHLSWNIESVIRKVGTLTIYLGVYLERVNLLHA